MEPTNQDNSINAFKELLNERRSNLLRKETNEIRKNSIKKKSFIKKKKSKRKRAKRQFSRWRKESTKEY